MKADQRIRDSRGLLADALALQESGVLVSGMTVTDLATGFVAAGNAEMQRPGYMQYRGDAAVGAAGAGNAGSLADAEDPGNALGSEPPDSASNSATDSDGLAEQDIEFQRSGLSLGRLSELFELVCEVLDQRGEYPEATAVNPPEPREFFPWGIGLREVDVLVTGSFAVSVVHYLRVMGIRARLVDNDTVLRVASELAVAQQELEHLGLADLESEGPGVGEARAELLEADRSDMDEPMDEGQWGPAANESAEDVDEWEGVEEGASIRKEEHKANRRLPVALAALALFIIGGLVTTFTVYGAQGEESTENTESAVGAEQTRQDQPEAQDRQEGKTGEQPPGHGETSEERQAEDNESEPFPEPHKKGEANAGHSARRADIPISVNVAGWGLNGATNSREEYVGGDKGMRVLVAAKKTPLQTQEELDAAMLGALKDVSGDRAGGSGAGGADGGGGAGGAGGVNIVSTQPVSYEESYPNSTTLWHVRLVDGHQISVGCQYRQWNEQREKLCQEFVETARPEK